MSIEEQLKQFLIVLSVSLSVATLPQMVSWFRQIPYTLLLVIVGLGLALVDVRLVNLSPELILLIFLPPLLFEAAWNLKWSNLKQDLIPICLYAVMGVLVSILGLAFGLQELAGIPMTTALLIGASLSATDPVSVTALFRELGVDERLTTLMEGESLFNDGMAVVAFSFLVSLSGHYRSRYSTNSGRVCRRCWYRGRGRLSDWVWRFLSNPAIRSASGGTVLDPSFCLWDLLNYRGYGRVWGDWSCYHWLDFGQLRFTYWHEPAHPTDCLRILGVFGIFCQFYCFLADWGPGALCHLGKPSRNHCRRCWCYGPNKGNIYLWSGFSEQSFS